MIWGMTLKPGVSYTKVLDEEVHLSLASMESREQFGRIWPGSYSQVVMKTEDVEVLLCTLVHGSTFQQTLDLKLMPKEKITFTAYGECVIYISGYSNSGPKISNLRSVLDHVIDGVISSTAEANMATNDKEIEESSWIPEPEEQTEIQKRKIRIEDNQTSRQIVLHEEEEQDCIEVMSYEDVAAVKSEPNGGAVHAGTDNADEYSVVTNIASYAQESVMTAVQRYTMAGVQETGKDGGSIVQSQMLASAGPIPTSLVKIEGSSSKENGITRQAVLPQSSSFGSSQVVGTVGSVSVARTRSYSGSSQAVKMSDQNHSLQEQGGSDTGNYVFSVSGTPMEAGSDMALSYTPHVKVKIEKDSRRLKSKRKSNTSQRKTAVSSRSGKQYRCHYCHKSFMHAHSMVRHERIHTGIKPYQCRICLKKFSDIGNKAKHERTHSDRGFECGNCGKLSNSYDTHRKHVKLCMR